MTEWHNAVRHYPKGVMVGPTNVMHEGPEHFTIDRTGYYRWEYSTAPSTRGWSLVGPFRTSKAASRGDK